MHGEAAGRDLVTAVGAAIDKIDRQGRRLKEKWKAHKRRAPAKVTAGADIERGSRAASVQEAPVAESAGDGNAGQVRVIRARRYEVKPMSVDEAAHRVGSGSAAFLVFRNDITDAVAVLFRRPDGHLGLIEPEV
jgi:putative sigma-54 modulation protein